MCDETWAEQHGYRHIRCSCGWHGWTDGDCERCSNSDEGEDCERCYDCEAKLDDCTCKGGPRILTKATQTFHVARKEHRYGFTVIRPGDRYQRTVHMGYVKGGGRWMEVAKYVLKRAA